MFSARQPKKDNATCIDLDSDRLLAHRGWEESNSQMMEVKKDTAQATSFEAKIEAQDAERRR